MVTYRCETWSLTEKDVNNLHIFERKILRNIYGPIQLSNNCWRIRTNDELEALIRTQKYNKIHQGTETLIAWTH